MPCLQNALDPLHLKIVRAKRCSHDTIGAIGWQSNYSSSMRLGLVVCGWQATSFVVLSSMTSSSCSTRLPCCTLGVK